MELWIIATLFAATLQTVRFMLQKILSETKLTTAGATFSRFFYSAPVLWIIAIIYLLTNHRGIPEFSGLFLFFAFLGGLSQILATLCVVALFRSRNFAVGITFKKTEVVQSVMVGLVLLNEGVSMTGLGAIIIGLLGVLLLSDQTGKEKSGAHRFINRATGLGIMSGFLFAISAVAYRGATLGVFADEPILRATFTLLVVVTFQMIVMTVWLFYREPGQILKVWKARKTALWVGLTSLGGSLGWFTAFSVQNAAYVKAVGQIELVLSLLATVFFFKERVTLKELSGVFLLVASILILVILT